MIPSLQAAFGHAMSEQVFERGPLGSALLDTQGTILATNHLFAELLGQVPAALVGRRLDDLVTANQAAAVRAQVSAVAGGQLVTAIETPCFGGKAGSPVYIEVHLSLLQVDGHEPRLLALMVDRTEREQMEQALAETAQRLSLATRGAGVGIWDLDLTSWRIRLDAPCQAMYGLDLPDGSTAFANWLARLNEHDAQALQQQVAALMQPHAGSQFAMEFSTRGDPAEARRIRSQGVIHRDDAGLPLRALGANWDITSEYQQQAKMRMQAAAMNAASNAMFITDATGHIVWVNRAFEDITGYDAADVIGQTPRLLKSGRQSELWYRSLWQTLLAGNVWRGHVVNRRKDGRLFDVEQTVTPIRDERGQVVSFVSVHEDVTERVRSEQRIRRLALYDGITGLANRTAFIDGLGEALARARRNGLTLGVVLIDLDHFKNVNDSLGHDAGDMLLAQVSRRLRDTLRETDLPARLGGDEFGVLVENVAQPEQILETAQRLLEQIRRPYELHGHTAHISASIGMTTYPGDADSPELLLKHADLAMYEAKAAGRNCVRYFDAAMDATARRRFATETALHGALRDDVLHLVYQPQFALHGDGLVGFEALLRWTDAKRGPISPAEFVPLAEQSGLILQLNEWVLRQALRQAASWKARYGRSVPIAINVGAAQFEQAGFDEQVAACLHENCLNGTDIELEITEGVMLRDGERVRSNLRGLEAIGVKLAIDDFGTGYSSLQSLRDYPVSRLKLDASFVHGIGRKSKDEQIIRAVVGLSDSLALQVIAEGVETAEQARFLSDAGCEQVQGFFYARPLSAADASALIERSMPADTRALAS